MPDKSEPVTEERLKELLDAQDEKMIVMLNCALDSAGLAFGLMILKDLCSRDELLSVLDAIEHQEMQDGQAGTGLEINDQPQVQYVIQRLRQAVERIQDAPALFRGPSTTGRH